MVAIRQNVIAIGIPNTRLSVLSLHMRTVGRSSSERHEKPHGLVTSAFTNDRYPSLATCAKGTILPTQDFRRTRRLVAPAEPSTTAATDSHRTAPQTHASTPPCPHYRPAIPAPSAARKRAPGHRHDSPAHRSPGTTQTQPLSRSFERKRTHKKGNL